MKSHADRVKILFLEKNAGKNEFFFEKKVDFLLYFLKKAIYYVSLNIFPDGPESKEAIRNAKKDANNEKVPATRKHSREEPGMVESGTDEITNLVFRGPSGWKSGFADAHEPGKKVRVLLASLQCRFQRN